MVSWIGDAEDRALKRAIQHVVQALRMNRQIEVSILKGIQLQVADKSQDSDVEQDEYRKNPDLAFVSCRHRRSVPKSAYSCKESM